MDNKPITPKELGTYLFPELAESEDERIRKAIKYYVEDMPDTYGFAHGIGKKEMLSYLENLKEPKPGATKDNPINPFDTKLFQDGVKEGRRLEREEKQKEKQLDGKAMLHVAEKSYQIGLRDGKMEQKLAWNEEDEDNLKRAIEICINDFGEKSRIAKFLKSLPERFNLQSKQEWSEEDKDKLNRIYHLIGVAADKHAYSTTCRLIGDREAVELQDFLKSLRSSCWKPSEEQMDWLATARRLSEDKPAIRPIVESLYDDLMKLM